MLHGYTAITQGKSCSSKGGLVIYIDNKYKAEPIMNLNIYEHWEELIIKVNGGNLSKSLTIGNIYRPPRTNNEQINSFINEFSPAVVSLENNNHELIIAGDFNINFSDHQPYFMILGITQKTVRPPKYVKINILSTEAKQNVRHEIKSDNIYNKLNKIPNAKFKL